MATTNPPCPNPLKKGEIGSKVPRLVHFHGRGTRPEMHPLFKGDLATRARRETRRFSASRQGDLHQLCILKITFQTSSKISKGFKGAGILEIVEDFDGDTYRAVYTVKFAELVYVLHVFQNKSKSGIATPKVDLELIITSRLKLAQEHYQENYDDNRST